MLVLSRGPEEAIMIGGLIEVKVLEVRGDRVRLGILAPSDVSIHRKEVFLSIQKETRAAAASEASVLDQALNFLGESKEGQEEEPREHPQRPAGGLGRISRERRERKTKSEDT